MDRLQGPRLKVQRADRHIRELEKARDSLIGSDVYRIPREDDPETGDLLYRVVIDTEREAIGLAKLAVIAGDAIHSLRAALDLLAYQLVDAHSGADENAMFTVHKSKEAFVKAEYGAGMNGADPRAIEKWKILRPYNAQDGGNPTLWALHRLDIWDKHRLLYTVGAQAVEIGVKNRWMPRPIAVRFGSRPKWKPLKDGDIIHKVEARHRGVPENEDYPESFVFDVAFGETEVFARQPLIPTVRELRAFVLGVVLDFAPFLREDENRAPS